MRRSFTSSLLLLVVASAAAVPLACGSGGSSDTTKTTGTTGAGGSSSSGDTGGSGAGGDFFTGNGGGPMADLTISPPSATIDVVDGASSPVDFDALQGSQAVNPSWVVDLSSIANVDKDGIVTATNQQGGEVSLVATYDGKKATATVTVNLHQVINPAGATAPDQAILKAAVTPDADVQWAYPYDGTVFPKGLLAPELMWNGGGADDLYYLHFVGKYVDYEIFTKAAPPSRFTLDDATWKALTESGKGGALKLHVARLPAGAQEAKVVVDHTWTIANGSMRGTVYYWSNNLGRVLRIKPGAPAPEDFLGAAGLTNGCTTCHSVSANGSTMIIGGDAAASTWDLLTNTLAYDQGSYAARRAWAMPAISPNGKALVENNAPLPGPPGGSDGMFDPATGAKLPGTGLEGIFLDMPAFGPSGTKLAFVDHASKALGVFDFDMPNNTVSNQVSLVQQGADAAIAFPSVSPDAKWIVYHRGVLDTRNGAGDLYLASIDQPGLEIRLSEIDGDNYPFAAGDRDKHYNYEPTFAPLNSGGYAWVVFTSRRTYGNRLVGTKDATKQLWVAAVDQDPIPGQDPSHPAFRVPGQDDNLNMRGFWALDPCKQIGDGCGTGSECCNQNCAEGICKDPNPSECVQDGNHCEQSSECCEKGSECINHICSAPPPQ
jgi:hypothetical protein